MSPAEELFHTVLQKLIVMLLGLLTVGVILTSCTYQKTCSAYNDVEIEQTEGNQIP